MQDGLLATTPVAGHRELVRRTLAGAQPVHVILAAYSWVKCGPEHVSAYMFRIQHSSPMSVQELRMASHVHHENALPHKRSSEPCACLHALGVRAGSGGRAVGADTATLTPMVADVLRSAGLPIKVADGTSRDFRVIWIPSQRVATLISARRHEIGHSQY